jgi:DNA-binding transcriptional LysR family regulator
VRKRHGVAPTEAGQTLLEHARAMLASAGRIERDMSAYASGVRGQVRILASASAIAESLADDIASFLKAPAHRNIQVDIEERVSPEIVRGVREGIASLGICWDAADLGALASRPYRSDHLAIVVPEKHPLASRKKLRFEEALDFEFVGLAINTAVQVMMHREAAQRGRTVRQRVIVSSFEAALRVVRAGLAISLVPREVADLHAQAYRLKVIPLAEPWAERRFIICFRDASSLSPAARLLVDHLASHHKA